MNSLHELLERVKAASGPDQELDAAVHMLMSPDDTACRIMRGEMVVESWECGYGGLSYVSLNSGGTSGGTCPIPRVTASLDAAVALVERALPGGWFRLGSGGPPWAEVPNPPGVDGYSRGYAATPALALLAAMLSALIARDHIVPKERVPQGNSGTDPKPQDLSARDQ